MNTKTTYQVASRTSDLALIMTNEVVDRLKHIEPNSNWDIMGIKTISEGEDKARFSTPLNEAVGSQRCRLAVHSAKDLPSVLENDIVICAILKREDPSDAFISHQYEHINQLPENACIGTSSLRRTMLLKTLRPDLRVMKLRGNVDTRTKRAKDFDGIILATSGLKRMQLQHNISSYLDTASFIPAPGQGAIALTCLKDDYEMIKLGASITDPVTALCVNLERALCAKINFSCHDPIGVYIEPENDQYRLHVMLTYDRQLFHRNVLLNEASLPDYIERLADDILNIKRIS